MRRRLAIGAAACAIGASIVAISMGVHDGLQTLALLLAVCACALMAAAQAKHARRRIRSLSGQLALAVGIAVGAILIAVWLAASLMFISADDALLVSVMAAVIAIVGICAAGLTTDPLVRDIELLRDRLRSVGLGSRRADIETGGADELADLAAAANSMIEQLAQEEGARAASDRARRGVITALSHDLRTPLTAVQALTEAIQDGIATGATRARYLREMQLHVAALAELIDDLFELSRAEGHTLERSGEPVEVGELVSETVAAMRASAERSGVVLHSEPPAGRAHGPLLAAWIDPRQIRRVLLNLLDNAIRHTPAGGAVHARTTRRRGMVRVQVQDEGSGIAPEEVEKVFEAFYRGGEDGASRRGGGAGLGLAIARAILEAHGGEIWIPPSDRGTTVCFSLPALPGGRLHPSEPARADAEPAATGTS